MGPLGRTTKPSWATKSTISASAVVKRLAPVCPSPSHTPRVYGGTGRSRSGSRSGAQFRTAWLRRRSAVSVRSVAAICAVVTIPSCSARAPALTGRSARARRPEIRRAHRVARRRPVACLARPGHRAGDPAVGTHRLRHRVKHVAELRTDLFEGFREGDQAVRLGGCGRLGRSYLRQRRLGPVAPSACLGLAAAGPGRGLPQVFGVRHDDASRRRTRPRSRGGRASRRRRW